MRVKKIFLWAAGIVFAAFIAVVIYRIPHAVEQQKTAEAVAKIHATKLTLDDVMGKNLPPDPGLDANKTIEGVDANKNGIRDDVELAIFKKYPNLARIRAAELQYAMALQNELTSNVFNSETLVAAIQEEGRGFGCIYKSSPTDQVFNVYKKEIRDLVFNTDGRKKRSDEIFNKYMTSFATLKGQDCDIESVSLPN